MRRRQIRLISLVLLLGSQTTAVEVANPSKTSIGSAARRALAARDYGPTVRNPDWLAEIFVGPNERKIMAATGRSGIWKAITGRPSKMTTPSRA
jgi:hypothetical protein